MSIIFLYRCQLLMAIFLALLNDQSGFLLYKKIFLFKLYLFPF